MLVINASKILSAHVKVPKAAAVPAGTTPVISWHADFFSKDGVYYYVLVNDANPLETIALYNPAPLEYEALAQNAAERIARYYAQIQNKAAFDTFQEGSREILIVSDSNKNNFKDVDEKVKGVKHQLRGQVANQEPAAPKFNGKNAVTQLADKNARKFYGSLMTHAVHKNTKGK
ncbi:hypothetical protein EQG49_01780 [Periweissella cryptocerci]|uniref:Uncharacterized protein n=1 Tax=Periweissella cryptocerci TaxID=2506420 RepID=A0A4P6YRJ3_9LACO|nr:hypothetical protein [Periweissella cryptocerci]QBO35279.1 hypothetical protein EQG49_01780 [Periweissella cryptocerci]